MLSFETPREEGSEEVFDPSSMTILSDQFNGNVFLVEGGEVENGE